MSEVTSIDDMGDAIAKALPSDTLVIFQCDDKVIKNVAAGLGALRKTFARYGITAIAVPNSIVVMAIPSGTRPEEVKLREEKRGLQ